MGRILITAEQAKFLKTLMDNIEVDDEGAVIATNLPDASELEDGTYTLTATVSDGEVNYSWS